MKNYCLDEVMSFLGCSRREVQKLINGDGRNDCPPRLAHFHVGNKKMVREQDLKHFIHEEMMMGKTPLEEWEAEYVNRV